ncbi:hypothetical protein C5S29_03035, partial [ANME-1 cluster archaeon GoMg3.2]|nr:hypothetical protein [ANME-1 cluster archaeon GoMg3.2]
WQLADEINGLPGETTDDVLKSLLLRAGAKYITNALQKYVGQMKRGESPTDRTEVSKWLNPDIPDLKNFEMMR